jgi:hypothetical protein
MKRIICLLGLSIVGSAVVAQTLQTVTNNGSATTSAITVGGLISNAASFAGIALPTNISSLNGLRLNGNISDNSHNGITYQSGGGGGAAITFFRGGSYETGIDFYTSGGGPIYGGLIHRMRIANNGFVGIGTTSPTEQLSVKGKIRAQEVKVELTNWADFVFAKDYQLPSLAETEKHIKEFGHLPGIPSAAKVARDGIELGDMNKRLLQKIEELTLYLIEQNNSIKKLQSQNTELRLEVEKIKTKL